jgi:hypothetical protein
VAVDAHGDLFIADDYNNVVEEVSPAGRLSVVAGDGKQGRPTPGPANRSDLRFPSGVAVDAQGDLFIADSGNNVVEEVTPAGRLSVVAGDGKQGQSTAGAADSSALDVGQGGVAVDARGDLFIVSAYYSAVEKVNPAGSLSVLALSGVDRPPLSARTWRIPCFDSVAVHVDLFIADGCNDVVDEVTPDGRFSVVAGDGKIGPPTPGPADSSALGPPEGVAVDAHGDLFIADVGNNDIEKVTF